MMSKGSGVSLISCMLALLVLSSLLLFASNTFVFLSHHADAKSLRSLILSEIHYARSLALTHHAKVTLCPTTSGKACESSWADGQLVLIGDAPVRVFQPRIQGSLAYHGFGPVPYVQFDASAADLATNGSFVYSQPGGDDEVWRIVINKAGRVR